MKTRNGKIARLPAQLREELNQHLDDGHPGNSLADWLNSLDEVQEVLVQHFEGRPISPQNVSEWRRGGYLEWRAERDLFHTLQNSEHGKEIANADLNADRLIKVFLGRSASAMNLGEEHLERLASLYPLVKMLLGVQKNEFAAERVAIARDRLELQTRRAANPNVAARCLPASGVVSPLNPQPTVDPNVEARFQPLCPQPSAQAAFPPEASAPACRQTEAAASSAPDPAPPIDRQEPADPCATSPHSRSVLDASARGSNPAPLSGPILPSNKIPLLPRDRAYHSLQATA